MPGPGEYDKLQGLTEKRLNYRFWQKAEERPRHTDQIANITDRPNLGFCPRHHSMLGWAGPPHAPLPQRYVCLDCGEWASEDEIRERGFAFDEVQDIVIHQIMDARLQARAKGKGRLLFLARR